MRAIFKIGSLVTFNYELGEEVHTKNPTVLVLHGNWACHPRDVQKRCVHGLAMTYLNSQTQNYIRAVCNPDFAKVIRKKDKVIDEWLKRIDNLDELDVRSPQEFYEKFIRGFIKPRGWEPYRRYRIDKIQTPYTLIPATQFAGQSPSGRLNKFANKQGNARGPRLNNPFAK